MISIDGPRMKRAPKLVQLTDQAAHRAIGFVAAVVTTWYATRPGSTRGVR
jgi:hypothetical protein